MMCDAKVEAEQEGGAESKRDEGSKENPPGRPPSRQQRDEDVQCEESAGDVTRIGSDKISSNGPLPARRAANPCLFIPAISVSPLLHFEGLLSTIITL